MRHSAFNILLLFAVTTLFSFGKERPARTLQKGTYGFCDCSGKGTAVIALELKPDFTFRYTDRSDRKKQVFLTGTYSYDGQKLVLKDFECPFSIHDTWTVDNNENCLKSRNKLNFRRLCLVEPCE